MKHIFFFEPNVKIKEYLKKGYETVKNDDLSKYNTLEWIYFSSQLPKKYKNNIYNIQSKWINGVIYEKPNIFDKNDLYQIMISTNKDYLIEQISLNNKSNKQINDFMKKNQLYIIKPIPGSGGIGVKVFNQKDKLKDYIRNFEISNLKKQKLLKTSKIKKWVLQKYIENPLLLDGKKFHIRVLFLNLMKNGQKLFYLFNKFFIYTAEKKYTNSTLNKNVHNTHISTNTELKRAMTEYDKLDLKKRKNIRKQVIDICKDLKPYMKYKCYDQSKNCYQFAGLDLIVTNDHQVKLIEINERPGAKGPSTYPSFWKGLLDLTLYEKTKTKDYIKL